MTDPLVTTAWLASQFGDPTLRVVDGSFRMPGVQPTAAEDHAAAHLPGAVFFDIDAIADRASPLPHMLPAPDDFARAVAALGIGNDDLVVVYDAGNYMGAPRVWWTFRVFGHRNVRVLDGGLKKWRAEGRPLETGRVTPRPARFAAAFEPARVRDKAALVANLATCAEQIVDARARERFEGTAAEPWPGRRPGRIPQSRNVPFGAVFDAASGVFKPADELARIFAAAGVDLARPLVTSCGSGVTAATLTLALARLGVDATALYDGSWAEWGLPDGPPITSGVNGP
ncbi:MAG: 3-mercaptopyruvate sulfurtransferase [Xanthobacteraceae bacterium]|nr:MAG: 3-mercaptopyruvate sulfurtransferase [Xanthobacteraceae bacterium]